MRQFSRVILTLPMPGGTSFCPADGSVGPVSMVPPGMTYSIPNSFSLRVSVLRPHPTVARLPAYALAYDAGR